MRNGTISLARTQPFLDAVWSDQFKDSDARFQSYEQKTIDRVAFAIMKGETTLGMRIKPIEPETYDNEARVNDADRLIHRIEGGSVYFADIVPHDLIWKYGKKR